MDAKKVSESKTEQIQMVMAEDINGLRTAFRRTADAMDRYCGRRGGTQARQHERDDGIGGRPSV